MTLKKTCNTYVTEIGLAKSKKGWFILLRWTWIISLWIWNKLIDNCRRMGFLYFVSFLGLSNSSSCSRSWLLQCSCSCWSNDNTFYITGMNEVLRRIRSSTNTWYTYSFHLGGTQTSNMCSSRNFSLHSKRFRASSSRASFVLVSLSPPPPPPLP